MTLHLPPFAHSKYSEHALYALGPLDGQWKNLPRCTKDPNTLIRQVLHIVDTTKVTPHVRGGD